MTLLVLAVGFQSLGEIRFAWDIAMLVVSAAARFVRVKPQEAAAQWRRIHGLSSGRTGDFSALLGVGCESPLLRVRIFEL